MHITDRIRRARSARPTAWLLLAHVVVLCVIFTWRFPAAEGIVRHREYSAGEFRGGPSAYARLYFTRMPESYYYEWSTVVLGESFAPGYPVAERRDGELGEWLEQPPAARVPYRDVPFEYPPVLALPLLLAGAASWGFLSFMVAFAIIVAAAYLASLWYVHRIWTHLPAGERWPWRTVLVLSLASIGALGQIYVTRLDVFPMLLFVMACADFLDRRTRRAAVWLGAGFLAKGYAIVLAPLFGLALLRERRFRELGVAAAIVLAIVGVATLGLAWLTDGAYLDSYRYHAERGLQLESTYATVALVAGAVLDVPIDIFVAFNSWNIAIDDGGILLRLSSFLPPLAFAGVYALYWRLSARTERRGDPRHVVHGAVLLVLAFLLTFKVLSPQFLIWLIPLVFLAPPAPRYVHAAVIVAICAITQAIWPNFYHLLEVAHPAGVGMLAARNLGLAVLAAWVARQWLRMPIGDQLDGTSAPGRA